MSDLTAQLERQFSPRTSKPSLGLVDTKFAAFPRVHTDDATGERTLTWFVKALPWGNQQRERAAQRAMMSENAFVSWGAVAGMTQRIGPRLLEDAEVEEYLKVHAKISAQRGKQKDARRIANSPRAVIVANAESGTASIVKG